MTGSTAPWFDLLLGIDLVLEFCSSWNYDQTNDPLIELWQLSNNSKISKIKGGFIN